MTRQVIEAGRRLRISVHDHIVVGRDGVASLKTLEANVTNSTSPPF
jgi:DNA repair protein RadC